MFTGLSTVATRRVPPRLGWPCAQAGRSTPGPTREPSPAPAASPPIRRSHSRRVLWVQSAPRVWSVIARSSFLCSFAVAPMVVDHAVLHDEAHLAERLDVRER